MSHLSDQEIVSILKTGQHEDQVSTAWNCLIEKYMPDLDRQARRWWNGNEAEADDCVQEAWINVYGKINSFEDGNLRSWLLVVLRNKCIDSFRRKRRWNEDLYLGDTDSGIDDRPDRSRGQRQVDKESPRSSPEDDYQREMDVSSDKWKLLVGKYIGRDVKFFLEYQSSSSKSTRDRTKFSRLRVKLHSEAIRDFVSSGGSLEDIMNEGEANALTQKYSLNRREADIFHWMLLQSLEELHQLIFSAARKLFEWLLDQMPDTKDR